MFSVIVTIDNHYELTRYFFEKLLQTTDFSKGELIIVTDGCNDKNTMNYLNDLHASKRFIRLIVLDKKQGVSKANNIGVNIASNEDLVFINTDVLLTDNSIQRLVNYINSDSQIGVAQGRLVYPQNNTIQSTGHTFEHCYNAHVYKGKRFDDPLVEKIAERQALTSAFYAMKKEVFLRFGGFDEIYFNAYEGMELSLKIHKSGLKCMYYPHAVAYHITGGSRNSISFNNEYAGRLFWSKWGNYIEKDLMIYLNQQLTKEIISKTYFLIKCSSFDFWNDVLSELKIKVSGEISIRNRFAKTINLYNELSFEFQNFKEPLLFICNDISDLKNNYNWCEVRDNNDDVIFDTHGNIEKLSTVTGCRRVNE